MADQNINNMTVTWNSGGTTFAAVKMNVTDTASAAASLLLQFQVGGSDKFKVGKDGTVTGAGNLSIAGNATIAGNVTITGTLTAAGIAGTVTGPLSSTDNAIARFNGTTGSVLQNSGVTIDDSNNITTAGVLTVGTYVQSSSANAVFAPTGAGAIYLRPNGVVSSVGQMYIQSTGAVTVNGTLSATGAVSGTTGTFSGAIAGTTGTFSGAISGTSGTFTSTVTGLIYFQSSTAAVVLAPTGAGTVYLRPNGTGSTSGQMTIAASGNATINGTLTVTG